MSQKKALDAAKATIVNDQNTITLLKVGNPDGNAPLGLQAERVSIATEEQNLQNLKNTLANYVVTAPFDGMIASVAVQLHDTAGSGSAAAVLITKQKIAKLSLNEVDVAKIALDDKVTLTFDAIPDLTIAGSVSEIDPVGTVSQGVVTYNVKIVFDSIDDRVKPGMSVPA